jgi:prevent-host-death family protein
MKQVSVTELKNQLSRYLRLVKRGEIIEILEHSVPVARLEGVQDRATSGDGHLERLRRDGIVLPAKRRARLDLLREPPIPCRGDAVQAVVDERGDR